MLELVIMIDGEGTRLKVVNADKVTLYEDECDPEWHGFERLKIAYKRIVRLANGLIRFGGYDEKEAVKEAVRNFQFLIEEFSSKHEYYRYLAEKEIEDEIYADLYADIWASCYGL